MDTAGMNARLVTGEIGKWVLSGTLFLFVFIKVEEVNEIYLFVCFLLLQSFNLFVPLATTNMPFINR